ncbi:YlbE-like family protein [Fredinandcohnia quinoae]|uniref:YlbE-like family protein n=1 Tax=Fredinandcohnia quinoae TaxID=2918902 RepID=A0AAW5E2U8_9BACI|nr:YlbE-like family protein [Fredinandcohnia sp. SECRCQ15]MCH1623905.1 YlbE-like family protein [Fredinandcohnia sp. SECRCQ15]
MRKETYTYIENNKQLRKFIRENPMWYRKLTRNPTDIQLIEHASKEYFQKTFPHRIQQFNHSLELASFMIQMYQGMRQSD